MPLLLLATSNPGKLLEFRSLLADLPLELIAPADLGLTLQVEETGATYAENAALKARAFSAASGLPTLGDDSGLEVAVLGGAPGLHSARFVPHPTLRQNQKMAQQKEFPGGSARPRNPKSILPGATDAERRALLLQVLAGHPQPWAATFKSAICLAYAAPEEGAARGVSGVLPTKLQIVISEGSCNGEIIPEERGTGGFGYDRIFLVEGLGRTMAELSLEEKNQVSHRARAMAKMVEVLKLIAEG